MQNICLGALVVTHAMLRRLTSRRCYLFAVPYKIYSSPQLQAINSIGLSEFGLERIKTSETVQTQAAQARGVNESKF